MKRTIPIKLSVKDQDNTSLQELQQEFARACNMVVPFVVENRCWNQAALHHLVYYKLRENTFLGSQMTCNAIKHISSCYKAIKSRDGIPKSKPVPEISFKDTTSVHFDKRIYSIKGDTLSLWTQHGRVFVDMILGDYQKEYFEKGTPKEGDLVCKNGTWYFNLVFDFPDVEKSYDAGVMGIDIGENNLAATSTGKIFSGGEIRHRRDRYLALRGKLQSNGSQSAKQRLKKVSGQEKRFVKHTNHEISRAIISEAANKGIGTIVMEDLTNIRDRIKGGKRMKNRLHRWSFRQLQTFIEYKAQSKGIKVEYVNPAYTSVTCSDCGCIGHRNKHQLVCSDCGSQLHSDVNASINLSRLASTAVVATGSIGNPKVPRA